MNRVPMAAVVGDRGLVGGPFGSSLVSSDYTADGVPVIRGANMGEGRYIGGEFAFVSEDKLQRDLSRNTARPGDVVFTQRGTLGQVALVPEGHYDTYVVSQSQMRLRVDPAVADSRYVYYASTSADFLRQIADRAISTGVPHTNLGILAELEVPLPSLSVQRAIAEVLGALDDKIAANAALAATVEDLVQTEFHAIAPKSQLTGATFSEVAQISGGGTPSTSEDSYWDGDVWWATPTDMTALAGPYLDATSRTISESGLAACSSKLYSPGAILMTSRATIGVLAVNTVATAVNQGFIVVEPNDDRLRWWLFHQMRARADELLSWANGATFLELSRANFKQLPAWTLPEEELDGFAAFAESLHSRARAALTESRTLAATRDALLPQLMSGRLLVRDAEAAASDAGV